MTEEQLSLARTLRAHLQQARIQEAALLGWLKTRGAIPQGVSALQSIKVSHLQILITSWNLVRDQLS
jgi:hypothetical protein